MDCGNGSDRSEGEAMLENDGNITQQSISYGCIFCLTGKEQLVANAIEEACPEVRAVTMRQLKYRTHNKVKAREEVIVLPSYVFFKAPSYINPMQQFPRRNVFRFLQDGDSNWQLQGEDERFAKWLFQYDGLIGFSQAYQEGSRIRIVSGPLKDMEGKIVRVDKRGHSGQVVLTFNGKDIPVWMGFELIDPIG